MSDPIERHHLAAVPAEHRLLVARWLAQQARQLHGTLDRQWVFTAEAVRLAADTLASAAVDLVDPDEENTGVDHSNEVLVRLLAGHP